ncbi:MAG TPA: hypothetical protein VGE18_01895 [Candidatus Paceibacterota bacterium]
MFSKFADTLKDFFGGTNEIVVSADMALKDRITSPFYGYFLISWCVINWKIIYAAFFVDQEKVFEKFGLLRIEYLSNELFLKLNEVSYWLHFWIFPFISTLILFWISPYITREFYRKSLKNQIALKVIEIQETTKKVKEEEKLIKQQTNLIKEKTEKAKQNKKAGNENPEILWEEEFKNFISSSIFSKFTQILDSIYIHEGKIRVESAMSLSYSRNYDFEIDKDVLVFADTNNLIKISNGKTISLTDKGKFFAQKYSQSDRF